MTEFKINNKGSINKQFIIDAFLDRNSKWKEDPIIYDP